MLVYFNKLIVLNLLFIEMNNGNISRIDTSRFASKKSTMKPLSIKKP